MHITIYVNKANSENFKEEKEKSKLINMLLDEHYEKVSVGKIVGKEPIYGGGTYRELVERAAKDAPDKYCKNGHYLSATRDRCLTKGCKYS